ncbi:MAG: hypothetical protein ACQEW8_07320 [Actinomycetota bacterium]
MSTLTLAQDKREAVASIVKGYEAKGKDEWWLLEPGDPFYENYERFEATNGEGPEVIGLVQYFNQEGDLVTADWESVRPKKLSKFDLNHFRKTPNAMLLGRDGTIIVSAGWWGRREKSPGVYEYLPIDEFRRWRETQMLTESRTIENKPAWAEETVAYHSQSTSRVDYRITRGDATYWQTLLANGLSEPFGEIATYFKTADELRAIARSALDLADCIDLENSAERPREVRRRVDVDDRLRGLDI